MLPLGVLLHTSTSGFLVVGPPENQHSCDIPEVAMHIHSRTAPTHTDIHTQSLSLCLSLSLTQTHQLTPSDSHALLLSGVSAFHFMTSLCHHGTTFATTMTPKTTDCNNNNSMKKYEKNNYKVIIIIIITSRASGFDSVSWCTVSHRT